MGEEKRRRFQERFLINVRPWGIGFEYIGYAQVVIATHAIATCSLIFLTEPLTLVFTL